MKKFFENVSHYFFRGLGKFLFFIWGIGRRIVYMPKKIYTDPSVKKTMKQPCIYIANHTNHADGSFVPQMFPGKNMAVIVMSKWYDKKGLNPFFRNMDFIRIDLNRLDTEWLGQAVDMLKAGKSILIFPEGMLALNGHLEEFKSGFLMIKKMTDAPVIPIALTGGYKAFHREKVIISPDIDFDVHKAGRPSVVFKEGAKLYQDRVAEMIEQYGD